MIHWFSPNDIRTSLLRGSKGLANFDLEVVNFKKRSRKPSLERLSFPSYPFQSFQIEFELNNDSGDLLHPEEDNIDKASHDLHLGNFMDKVLNIVRGYVDYDYSRGDDFSILIHPKDELDGLFGFLIYGGGSWASGDLYSYEMSIDGVAGISGVALFNFDP
jgi:hypothetical protein